MEFIELPLGTMACQGAISAKFASPGRIQTRPGQSVHDIFSLLVDRHEPIDEVILRAMLEGLHISEIAHALHVPRGFVERHRLRIVKQAVQLGINPVPANPLRRGCP